MSRLHFLPFIFALLTNHDAFSQSTQKVSSIHAVDFHNFTYPVPRDLSDRHQKTFKLTRGKLPETRFPNGFVNEMGIFLEEIVYGDVTGDGAEEAIIFMSILTGGSAIPGILYVYTLQNNQPKLLWKTSTGDRADEGFKNAFAKDGQLVVELFSPIGKQGDCCPTQYTQTVYEWRKNRFRVKRNQTFPLPQSK
ncbi:MAG TPA: hypothetical protein PLD20_29730 [Blastocatellia bacterium]|nr:hypothetical protein [Blastocatellia bacterium]HMV82874.1 hypothetical protein [Blastocatellia bacterium]HMX24407.1 hypothetical protein [Blastocatellia bacterium]HMZ22150.1 hypothetical protein [Blastocatellia bacterium]HNG29579.1 hypothetical protein [Blastocatellia bacterium]